MEMILQPVSCIHIRASVMYTYDIQSSQCQIWRQGLQGHMLALVYTKTLIITVLYTQGKISCLDQLHIEKNWSSAGCNTEDEVARDAVQEVIQCHFTHQSFRKGLIRPCFPAS